MITKHCPQCSGKMMEGAQGSGPDGEEPTHTWTCEDCGEVVDVSEEEDVGIWFERKVGESLDE